MPVHIGHKLKEILEAKRPKVNKTAFAKEVGRSRKNLYELFENPTIDSGVLAKASEILGHNFSQYLVKEGSMVRQPDPPPYGKQDAGDPIVITVKLDPRDPASQKKMAAIMKILAGN